MRASGRRRREATTVRFMTLGLPTTQVAVRARTAVRFTTAAEPRMPLFRARRASPSTDRRPTWAAAPRLRIGIPPRPMHPPPMTPVWTAVALTGAARLVRWPSRNASADAGDGSSSGCSCTASGLCGTGRPASNAVLLLFTLAACLQRRPRRRPAARSTATSVPREPEGGGVEKEGDRLQNPPGSMREEVAKSHQRA